MEFEWDGAKDRINFQKHGVGFEYAAQMFDGLTVTWPDTRRDYGEVRMHSIGRVDSIVVLVVIHTDRNGKIRIISARRADRNERNIYEKAIYKTAHH